MLTPSAVPVRLNHTQAKATLTAEHIHEALQSLVEEGRLTPERLQQLRVELDWLQYKQNFRDPVMISPGPNGNSAAPITEMLIDARRVEPETVKAHVLRALTQAETAKRADDPHRVPLEEFTSFRNSISWRFNQLYWAHFNEWEQWTGRGYEKALPGGVSDGHNPRAVADTVADFWTLLKKLDARNELPHELYFLEIGVGTGTRCGMWLNAFRELDQRRGTHYYPRLRVLLGDYSLATLDSSRPAVKDHVDLCSFLVLDAMHPLKTLSFLRNKILHIHATNVYDNLPDQEFLRRDGRLYQIEMRATLALPDVRRIAAASGVPIERFRKAVEQFVEQGPEYFIGHARAMTFWQDVWQGFRLEERLVPVEDLAASTFPEGLDAAQLQEMLAPVQGDVRFRVSSGALESLTRSLPLLHPDGFIQIQDIFVQDLRDYQRAFRGPGKMDGSIVSWVNGPLLKGMAERAGFDVHFAPFHYRKGATTSVLYASRKQAAARPAAPSKEGDAQQRSASQGRA